MQTTNLVTAPDEVEVPDLSLERGSYVPYYRQIRDQVEAMIKAGKLKPGQVIFSEGACATKLGVSKMTVRQAFQALRSEGLLIIEKGKRPVISAGRIQKDFQKLRGFTAEMTRRGLKPSSKVLQFEKAAPDAATANLLRLWRNDEVYRVRRLRYADKEIVGLETILLPARMFPDLAKTDLENQSLYALMETRYAIAVEWSEEELEAIPAEKDDAKVLQVPTGFPLFSMRRIVFAKDDIPVEYGHSLFRGDRYTASVISHR
jgi:GntR family transcriptional regulator